MKYKIIYFVLLVLLKPTLWAQDIKGAYIRTAYVPNTNSLTPVYQYSIDVILLTDANINVPRSTVTVTFTFGQTETYSLVSSVPAANNTMIKIYSGTHNFPGPNPSPSYYAVQYLDTFLIGGIKNFTLSQTQPICIESRLVANNYFTAKNSGTITNFPPILGVSGNEVVYNPQFVSTNDSISYAIVNYCNPPGYNIPNGATISPTSGILSFSKDSFGLYAFNIRIAEWGKEPTGIKKVHRTTYAYFVIDINPTVGITEDNYLASNHRIYPNPSNGILSVSTGLRGEKQVLLYCVTGNIVLRQFITEEQFSLDLSEFEKGIYFLLLTTEKGSITGKIIKD